MAYGFDDPSLLSPRIESVNFKGGEVRLGFSPIAGGLKSREGKPEGFDMAGTEGAFMPAQACIEGAEIVVWSESVPAPRGIRYAFADRPAPNLVNSRGLPLTPFRFSLDGSADDNSLLGAGCHSAAGTLPAGQAGLP